MGQVIDKLKEFEHKHPGSLVFRASKHARVVEEHLNPGEEVIYVFEGQKNEHFYDIFSSCVVALTNKRILIGKKRVVWGYFLTSITPDLYNDLTVYQGLFFCKIIIDTVKEEVTITNLAKSSLRDIETNITEMMMKEKQKYPKRDNKE